MFSYYILPQITSVVRASHLMTYLMRPTDSIHEDDSWIGCNKLWLVRRFFRLECPGSQVSLTSCRSIASLTWKNTGELNLTESSPPTAILLTTRCVYKSKAFVFDHVTYHLLRTLTHVYDFR